MAETFSILWAQLFDKMKILKALKQQQKNIVPENSEGKQVFAGFILE